MSAQPARRSLAQQILRALCLYVFYTHKQVADSCLSSDKSYLAHDSDDDDD